MSSNLCEVLIEGFNKKQDVALELERALIDRMISGNSTWVIPFLKSGGGRVRYLEVDEEKAMLETLSQWGDEELVDLIRVAIDTGFRQGELFNIQWSDLDAKMTTLTCWENKADHPRTVPLTARAKEVFVRLRGGPSSKLRTGGPFVHLDKHKIRYRWERLLTHLGLTDVVFHTLRHTTASRLVQRGIDLRRVQEFMGHRSIQTTLRYAHLAPNSLLDAARALEVCDSASNQRQNIGLSVGM